MVSDGKFSAYPRLVHPGKNSFFCHPRCSIQRKIRDKRSEACI